MSDLGDMQELEKMFNSKELTDEQKVKMNNIKKHLIVRFALSSFKFTLLLFSTSVAVAVINVLYVQSQGFAFVSLLLNGFLTARYLRGLMDNETSKALQEAKKIVDNK